MSTLTSFGFWLDRETGRLIEITDHAVDACAHPKRFRLTTPQLRRAFEVAGREPQITVSGHIFVTGEADREIIIPRVCLAGFIRVRYDARGATLGWQFSGNPVAALAKLHLFAKRRDLGPMVLVTFTDFGLGVSVTDRYMKFGGLAMPVSNMVRTWQMRYEQPGKI